MEETVKVDQKIRGVKSLKTSPEFIGFYTTAIDELTIEIDGDAYSALVIATLENSFNLRVFGIPQLTVYNDSVSEENMQPTAFSGGSWQGDIDFDAWLDWGASDNNNQKYKIFITAFSPPHPVRTVIIRVAWRTLFEDVFTTLERVY